MNDHPGAAAGVAPAEADAPPRKVVLGGRLITRGSTPPV